MEENTRNGFFAFGQRRNCPIWARTAAGLGKGQGTGRREAVGWEAQHRPEDVVRQMADLAVGWSRSDLQALPAARAGNTTPRRGCQTSLAGLEGFPSFQTCHIQQPVSEMLCGQVSLGKRLSEIRGKMGKKIRMASFRSREAESLSLVSLHKPAFPAHRATQPGCGSGKGWQPLRCSAYPASSMGAAGSRPSALHSITAHVEEKSKGN